MQVFNKIILILLMIFTIGCHSSSTPPSKSTFKVSVTPAINTLYYTGNISPIHTYTVSNLQADGVITQKNFTYGDIVKQGQLLFVIHSSQLAKNYQDALSAYAKAQKSYADAEFQMQGAEELNRLQIMSKQDYLNTKTQLFNASLDLAQAKRQLETLLQEIGTPLTAIDFSNLKQTLASIPANIRILAPSTGIALLPDNSSANKDSNNHPLTDGVTVKAGQSLLTIGDMSGITVIAKVSEIYIEKIKVGQKAIITGEAFPELTLYGSVTHVDRQASTDAQGSNLPLFSITITVPKLHSTEASKILVGMSANIALPLTTATAIKIPLKAVRVVNGVSQVKKVNPVTGKIALMTIKTGHTAEDTVEVIEGLKESDEVILDAATD